jgi:hypothetical protein
MEEAMRLKAGVKLADLEPQMALAAFVVARIFERRGLEAVITSANDSKHSAASWHYKGRALDFRTKFDSLNGMEESLREEIKDALGEEFDVIVEALGTDNEHLHLEYDPKEAT